MMSSVVSRSAPPTRSAAQQHGTQPAPQWRPTSAQHAEILRRARASPFTIYRSATTRRVVTSCVLWTSFVVRLGGMSSASTNPLQPAVAVARPRHCHVCSRTKRADAMTSIAARLCAAKTPTAVTSHGTLHASSKPSRDVPSAPATDCVTATSTLTESLDQLISRNCWVLGERRSAATSTATAL